MSYIDKKNYNIFSFCAFLFVTTNIMSILNDMFSIPTEDVKAAEKKRKNDNKLIPKYNMDNVPYFPLLFSSDFGSFAQLGYKTKKIYG